jgi:hypothetical protein
MLQLPAADGKDTAFAEFARIPGWPYAQPRHSVQTPRSSAVLDHAMQVGADKIATGHYARVRPCLRSARAAKGLDRRKIRVISTPPELPSCRKRVPGRSTAQDRKCAVSPIYRAVEPREEEVI